MTHTPGPWTLGHSIDYCPTINNASGEEIAAVWKSDNAKADALLMVTAPEMLEALKAALKFIPPPGEWDNEITKVREMIITAIYNAEG